MTWNYRVILTTGPWLDTMGNVEVSLAIHEVHYDRDDKPLLYIKEPIAPTGSDLQELKQDYIRQEEAFSQPTLLPEDFPKEPFGTDEEMLANSIPIEELFAAFPDTDSS